MNRENAWQILRVIATLVKKKPLSVVSIVLKKKSSVPMARADDHDTCPANPFSLSRQDRHSHE
jgi:hypothetical protein